MNQILDYTPNGSKRPKGNKNVNSDKIVRILAIFLIIFAVLLVSIAVYSRVSENAGKKTITQEETASDAKITTDVDEESNTVKIKVEHDKVITKFSYSWDTSKAREIDGEGKSEFETELDLSKGTHMLYISVADSSGHITSFQKQFTADNGKDIISPNIDIKPDVVDGKAVVIITATDETEMDYITYRWNNEDEVKITVDDVEDNDNRKKIEVKLEISEGSNDLTISAIDKAGKQATLQKTLNGLLNPTGKIEISEDKSNASVNVKHKNGISKITVRVNDGETQELGGIDELDDEAKKDITFDINLNDYGSGDKKIVVEAVSKDETKGVFEATVEGNGDNGGNDNNEPEVEQNKDIKIEFEQQEDEHDRDAVLYLIKIRYENGIKDIRIKMNGVNYNVGTWEENSKEVNAGPIKMPERNNKIEVTVYGSDGTQNTEAKNISF